LEFRKLYELSVYWQTDPVQMTIRITREKKERAISRFILWLSLIYVSISVYLGLAWALMLILLSI
jgi:hypothetical protein